jgi:hypothetical protein
MLSTSFEDARFPVRTTSLAACMGALCIPIAQTEPVSIIIPAEAPEKKQITFWFQPVGEEFLGEKHEAETIDWAWRNKDLFEEAHPDHPFNIMRRGVDAFAWLNRVWHGDVKVPGTGGRANFRTEDIGIASALKAAGQPLVKFNTRTREFFFRDASPAFLRDYEKFDQAEFYMKPAALVRRVLHLREILIGIIKNGIQKPDGTIQKCTPAIRHTDGGNPDEGCAVCDIMVGADPEVAAHLLATFHSL